MQFERVCKNFTTCVLVLIQLEPELHGLLFNVPSTSGLVKLLISCCGASQSPGRDIQPFSNTNTVLVSSVIIM